MPIDERLVLSEITLHRVLRSSLVLDFDPAALACDPLDQAAPARLQPRLSLVGFPLTTLTLSLEGTHRRIALSELRASPLVGEASKGAECLALLLGFEFAKTVGDELCRFVVGVGHSRQPLHVGDALAHALRWDADILADGVDLALMVDGDHAATIAAGEDVAVLLQRMREAHLRVRDRPAVLEHCLELRGVLLGALRLLPFGETVIAGVAFFVAHEAARHCPAMVEVKLTR
ncbi:MAG: hypothetical protein AAFR84_13030, partial [Pseudomonadota bacterium]